MGRGELRLLLAGQAPAGRADAADAGGDHAPVLHHLVAADRAAWTIDVAAVLAARQRPELATFYLVAAGILANCPGAFPNPAPPAAVAAPLDLRRGFGEPTPAVGSSFRIMETLVAAAQIRHV
ncbi:hypothetical protein AB0F77_20590 [Streptomyces sp. NPDC026672]|uniref:hypothetical protein n=1 Tax=unclassified Streptomyces TaxID=2593676 RepID=UPI0033F23492